MAEFNIVTDYQKNTSWLLSDNHGKVIQATAVGVLAGIGSAMGVSLEEQTDVFREMVERLTELRDNSAKFTPVNFPSLDIKAGTILPPASLDVSDLVASGIDIYSPSTNIADIDKLVQLESWLDQNFQTTTSSALKVSYRIPESSVDSWVVLKDALPIPTLSEGEVPVNSSGDVLLNKPFSWEGNPSIYIMVQDASGGVVRANVTATNEVFSKITSTAEYQNYIENLAIARATAAVNRLNEDGISTFSYDTIAWRKIGDSEYSYAKLPIVSVQDASKNNTSFSPGTILKTEKNEYFYLVSTGVTQKVELGSSYLMAPDEVSLAAIRSEYGDEVTIATQLSAKQSLFVNELIQKHTMHFDAASNLLKAFVDLMNKISNQV